MYVKAGAYCSSNEVKEAGSGNYHVLKTNKAWIIQFISSFSSSAGVVS